MKTSITKTFFLLKTVLVFSFFIFSFSFTHAQKLAGPPPLITITDLIDSNIACNHSFNETWGGAFYFNWSDATPLATTYTVGVWGPDFGRVYYSVTSLNSGTVAVPSYSGYVGPDTYKIIIEDNTGNSSRSTSFTITQPPALIEGTVTYTNVTCASAANAYVSPSGGTPPYSYAWTNGSSTISTINPAGEVFNAGTFTVITMDSHGCSSGDQSFTVTNTSTVHPLWWEYKDVKCYGGSDGVAVSNIYGGVLPYTYLWSNGNTTGEVTTLSAGTYTLTVTDNTGCKGVETVTITQPATRVSETFSIVTEPTCKNNPNGSAISIPAGGTPPYTYKWLPSGGTLQNSITLPGGDVECYVTDNNGCPARGIIALSEPAAVFANFTKLIPQCYGNSNGAVTASGTGGVSPYTYVWAHSLGSTAEISGLSTGTYTVMLTDNTGCTGTADIGLGQPSPLSITYTATACSSGKKNVTAVPSGGTGPYKYTWSTGATNISLSLSTGTYTLTLTDAHSCPSTFTTVTVSCPPSLIEDVLDKGGSNGSGNGLSDITVYPNPTNGQFTIAGLEQGEIIEMYDYTGRKISTISANDITMQLNLSNQSNGIYLIRILDKDGNLVGMKKVVKTQ